ncbi:hypothetical protein Tco_1353977 [Tanacetum coccineum]
MFRQQLLAGKYVLLDDEVKPPEKIDYTGAYDSEDEVEPVDNEMASFLASKPFGIDYGQEIPDNIQSICDNFDIKEVGCLCNGIRCGIHSHPLCATQGWIASVVIDKVRSDGDEQAYTGMHAACSKGFLIGCGLYVSLDACHLKGKFNGVLAGAKGIDINNSSFPVAYSVLEYENTSSWTWFLKSLKKAIGTPNGLVISSDMQKRLEVAIMQAAANTYCTTEHERLIKETASNLGEYEVCRSNDNHVEVKCGKTVTTTT